MSEIIVNFSISELIIIIFVQTKTHILKTVKKIHFFNNIFLVDTY